jgi:hypothetical protein
MGTLIQKLFMAFGVISLWLFAHSINILYSKSYKTELGYYLFDDLTESENENYFSNKSRFVIGILTFIFVLFVIDVID